MTKIRNKLKELYLMHDKHLNRPTMDDNFDEERSIDNLTQEITHVSMLKYILYKTKIINIFLVKDFRSKSNES